MTPLEFLESDEYEIEFGWLNKVYWGKLNEKKSKIKLNLDLMIAEIFVHEFTHYLFPDRDEEAVWKSTFRRIKRMSAKEIQTLAWRIWQKGIVYDETAGV